jgi:hypothetical protein
MQEELLTGNHSINKKHGFDDNIKMGVRIHEI